MDGRIVLGLGGTVDYELRWDALTISRLAQEHGLRSADLSPSAPIVDERSLLVVVLSFLATGDGGERFVESSAVIEDFAACFGYEITLGGTGVRAGLVLDRLGIPGTQHLVSIDENVRRLMPSSMELLCSATEDTLDPHLIVQFPAGATIAMRDGEIVAPASNRLIFANDPPNRDMALAPQLAASLVDAGLFLISGFNTMQDHGLLRRRVGELKAAMAALPAEALVYYEDAGFYDRSFSDTVRAALLDRIDVYGMNEDELQEYLGRRVDLLDATQVAEALRDVQWLIPAPVLVVHTRYWALARGPQAPRYRAALESAVSAAATRYRCGDDYDAADIRATSRSPRHEAGTEVVAAVRRVLPDLEGVAAFSIDTPAPTTIGLGDTFVGGFLAELARERSPRP